MKKNAFTLVELLVVIAIIVILIALLGVSTVLLAPIFGWIGGFLYIFWELQREPLALVIALIATGLFPRLLHGFLRQFRPQTTGREALQVACILFGIAISGIALMSGVHYVYWIATADEDTPLTEPSGGLMAARRMQSSNKLHHFGIAVHNYSDAHHSFPIGGTENHGWAVSLLPYLEQQKLYEKIQLDEPWTSPNNAVHFQTTVDHFRNPGLWQKTVGPFGAIHYSANERVLPVGRSLTFDDITDGTSNTLLFGEIDKRIPAWGHPQNGRDPVIGLKTSPFGFGGPFTGVTQFALVDGSTRAIKETIDPEVLRAIATPNGGEEKHAF